MNDDVCIMWATENGNIFLVSCLNITTFWSNKVDETLVELEDSEVPESNEGKGGVAMKLKESLIRELNILLFNNTSDTAGGERVRHLFNSFHQEVFKVSVFDILLRLKVLNVCLWTSCHCCEILSRWVYLHDTMSQNFSFYLVLYFLESVGIFQRSHCIFLNIHAVLIFWPITKLKVYCQRTCSPEY